MFDVSLNPSRLSDILATNKLACSGTLSSTTATEGSPLLREMYYNCNGSNNSKIEVCIKLDQILSLITRAIARIQST